MTVGDSILFLTLIEANARAARESLASAVVLQSQPDPILRPGEPPRPPNKHMAAKLMEQHHGAKGQMLAAAQGIMNADAKANATADTSPIAGRIGAHLNGDGNHG